MNNSPPTVQLYSFEEMLQTKGFIVYTCVGNSMLPFLRQRRDIVEIRPLQGRAKRYDVVLYKCGEKYILHRIHKVCPNDYVICGDNNIRREYGITDDMILGVMTRVIRDGKMISMDNCWYMFCVRLWICLYPFRVTFLYCKAIIMALLSRFSNYMRYLLGENKNRN